MKRPKLIAVVFTLLYFVSISCELYINQNGINKMSTPWQAQAGINEEENSKMMMKVVKQTVKMIRLRNRNRRRKRRRSIKLITQKNGLRSSTLCLPVQKMSMIPHSNFTVPAVMLTFCVLLVVQMILLNIRKHQNIKPILSQQKVK